MKIILAAILFASLLLPAAAQTTLEFTVNGTADTSTYSTVPAGTAFTETFTFANIQSLVGSGNSQFMSFTGGTYNLTAGSLTETGNAAIGVYSGASGGFNTGDVYGYLLSGNAGLGANYVQFFSSNSVVAPTPTLSNVQNFSLATFDKGTSFIYANGIFDYPYLGGTITSYSVVDVPEPSTLALLLCSFIGLTLKLRISLLKSKH